MECVWSLQRVTFNRLYLRISKATHPMGFIWESPKAHVTWESLKWHVSQALHKNPQSDKTHKLYSRITTTTHTMVSNAEGMYSKGFSQRKEAHPTSSTQSSFFAIVWGDVAQSWMDNGCRYYWCITLVQRIQCVNC